MTIELKGNDDFDNFLKSLTPEEIEMHLRKIKKDLQHKKLSQFLLPIINEINFRIPQGFCVGFGEPIDSTMVYTTEKLIQVCPLFILDLEEIPENLRPTGFADPRLGDYRFLQALADWISEEYDLDKQKVGISEIGGLITILKLKADPLKFNKACKAGIIHELGHIALSHHQQQVDFLNRMNSLLKKIKVVIVIATLGSLIQSKHRRCSQWKALVCVITTIMLGWKLTINLLYINLIKKHEIEADDYAVINHLNSVEGMRIGFTAWQETLKEIRTLKALHWTKRLLTKLLITPKGNLIPLLFTHGSFEERIRRAEDVFKKLR